MSTLTLPFQNQIRQLYFAKAVVDTYPAVVGDLQVDQDTDGSEAVTALRVRTKEKNGTVVFSDTIGVRTIRSINLVEARAKVGTKVEYTLVGLAAAKGKILTAKLKVNYSVLEDSFFTIQASIMVSDTDTAATAMAKLAVMLRRNIGADARLASSGLPEVAPGVPDNKYFTITEAAGKITIQEKDFIKETYSIATADDNAMWNFYVAIVGTIMDTSAFTIVNTPGVVAIGQGYQLQEAENFFGRDRGEFDVLNPGYNYNNAFQSDLNKTYTVVDVDYFEVPREDPKESKKTVSVAFESKAAAEAYAKIFTDAMNGPAIEPAGFAARTASEDGGPENLEGGAENLTGGTGSTTTTTTVKDKL